MKLLWKMRFILYEYWKQYLLAFISLQTVAILNLLIPYLIGQFVDKASDRLLTYNALLSYITLLIITAIAIYGLRYIWRSLLYGASIKLVKNQRDRLFTHFTRMSPDFYQFHTIGDLMAHATNDLNAVEESVGSGIMTLVDSFIAGITVLMAMIFAVSGKLTLLALLPFPLLIWSTSQYGKLLYKRLGRSQATFSSLNEEARETVSGVRAVRAHQLDQRQCNRYWKLSREAVNANRRVARIDSMFGPSIQLFFGMSFVIALIGGAWMIEQGKLTLGLLTSFTLYLGQLLGPMLQFGWQFNVFQRGSASWNRLEKLFDLAPSIQDKPGSDTAPNNKTLNLTIKSFSYPGAPTPVLNDIHLNVPEGSFTGITGRTGSGKSSLFRLLLREFDLEDPSIITLGEKPLDQITLKLLRNQYAWVPQEPMLLSGTIAKNIAFANPTASQVAVETSARLAAIHDEIMGLKNGYQTVLGEHGINLSGGQKQRVAFARALLSDSSILLLDDAFSALDMKTEATILTNMHQLKGKKTILLITQRLPELVLTADQIIVMDEGRITERGDHNHLLINNNWYARIFRQQSKSILLSTNSEQIQHHEVVSV